MSRVETPMQREPVEGTPRLSMSPARRARILDMYDSKCAREGCEETTGLELDHVIPLELGGCDADFNIVPMCRAHHAEKTRSDIRAIRKAQRLARDADPATRKKTRRPIRSRGFESSR